ncbi:beta-carotene 3-hydroxylase [Natronocella acetinitrilica]|uniref:Beta-carotene 3-hydroxylase n=1 Tax=Natronocella acetinitrilica TaxID=414046 RepID=A0AAE3KH19_9GAMM|nr:sterol desaturase family protein [Natronocella acetinitrilica]MCP1675877.1 beta-carotene 3-hydroxylase [Natronocella acetinitrilica]
MTQYFVNALYLLGALVAMEFVAWAAHKYIMHGWGWAWHRSHHEPGEGVLEKNDLYAVVFAGLSIVLIAYGAVDHGPTYWIGLGMTLYGFLYFLVHDGLVHKRWPLRYIPRSGYLKRLYQAHRLHHAVRGRDGCVSFGFLLAPPISVLREQLRDNVRNGRATLSEGREERSQMTRARP